MSPTPTLSELADHSRVVRVALDLVEADPVLNAQDRARIVYRVLLQHRQDLARQFRARLVTWRLRSVEWPEERGAHPTPGQIAAIVALLGEAEAMEQELAALVEARAAA